MKRFSVNKMLRRLASFGRKPADPSFQLATGQVEFHLIDDGVGEPGLALRIATKGGPPTILTLWRLDADQLVTTCVDCYRTLYGDSPTCIAATGDVTGDWSPLPPIRPEIDFDLDEQD